jgi:uncharacterized Rossmann fold enzyme
VFILGGGPSLADVDLEPLRTRRVIGVNQAYKLGPWVDICWFGDKQWYPGQLPAIRDFGGLIVTCAHETNLNRRWQRVKYVGRSKPAGIETKKPTHVAWNSSSGTSAVNLAYWLGASTVVLLGFDMKIDGNPRDKQARTHWHNDYEVRWDKRNAKLVDPYERFMRYWPAVAKDAQAAGLTILNATEGSALDLFPRVKLEEVL